jgi:hypothetical protein
MNTVAAATTVPIGSANMNANNAFHATPLLRGAREMTHRSATKLRSLRPVRGSAGVHTGSRYMHQNPRGGIA